MVETESLQLRTLITIAFLMRRLFSISYVLYLKRTCVNDARSLVLPFNFLIDYICQTALVKSLDSSGLKFSFSSIICVL